MPPTCCCRPPRKGRSRWRPALPPPARSRPAATPLSAGHVIEDVARPAESGVALLRDASERMNLTARGFHRVLKLARTIADLDGHDTIGRPHIAEALSYRMEAMRQSRAA